VLITGAASDIGRSTALRLAGLGHRVVASGPDEEALNALQEDARGRGLDRRLDTMPLDVADSVSVTRAARAFCWRLGAPDVLVNNAEVSVAGPLELVDDRDLREQFETNVFGLMAVTRAFVPAMRERGSGRILNVSSRSGRAAAPLRGPDHASTRAVEALSHALRVELARYGVKVVVVHPDAAPERVARVIERAIGAHRPPARYMSASNRLLLGTWAELPTRLADAVERGLGCRWGCRARPEAIPPPGAG
jgi:NAD(P)-dependent dehydrogenase (short-subunit alcohol dehydrogenase family)